MTPKAAIAMLDRELAKHGQTVVLRRVVANADPLSLTFKAAVRGFQPRDITDGITLGMSNVIMSPTSLAGSAFAADLPRVNDKISIFGRLRNIEAADPVAINDVIVRINLQVAG